jgi:membrane associated rhomboid family serine protease
MNGYERTQVVLPSPQQLFTPGVIAILVSMFAGFLITTLAGTFALDWLALNPRGVVHGRIWQLATYWIVCNSPWLLVLDGLLVLALGSAIERQWRASSLLALWMLTCVVVGLIWVAACLIGDVSYPGTSAAAGCFGLMAAFGLVFRGQRFLFAFLSTIEGQVAAWVMIGVGTVFCLFPPINLIWVLGALAAFVYIKLLWKGAARSQVSRAAGTSYRPGRFVDVD